MSSSCVGLSVKIIAEKSTTSPSSVHSWQLDLLYTYEYSNTAIWMKLPMPQQPIYIGRNDSIQAAVDAAPEGSTFYLDSGSYAEDLNIHKTLRIIAAHGAIKTHLFGEVIIMAPGVTFQGITFYPAIKSYSTITVNSSSASIINCRFIDSVESLSLYYPRPTIAIDCEHCSHVSIVNNDFYGWKHAVLLKDSNNAKIQTNILKSCQTALSIAVADGTRVTGNHFLGNVVAMKVVSSVDIDVFRQKNTFSGNVIPLVCGGKVQPFSGFQGASQSSRQVLGSQCLHVTATCNKTEDTSAIHNICSSIGLVQLPLGM